ncbi:MAG: type I-E CRISPR-associated protein Cas7/Cse4/CasC [Eubacteriales bacterium]|nr:type I-E CRISPR-associated protein Cas7/Cse4/CasC [Eubacteriales bacterium]
MKKQDRMYVDIHVIQTLPPSCVNRDDTGSPKTAYYGGVTRARVSSQAWKRQVRLAFADTLPEGDLSFRTKKIVPLLADKLVSLGFEGDAEKQAIKLYELAGLKIKNAKIGTDALFFISDAQVEALARLAMKEETPDKKAAQAALTEKPRIDIVLFGRMVANEQSMNTDACVQVAHAISTHRVENEYDYFTAVDDCSPEDNAGAGHVGTVEFNSSTMYRYATVAVHQLYPHTKDETADAVAAFVKAFVCAMPTGKQNTFANRTLPDAVLVTIRRDQPLNLVGAFEKPIRPSDNGYVEASAKRLADYAKKCYSSFADKPEASLVAGELLGDIATPQPLGELLDELRIHINELGAEA